MNFQSALTNLFIFYTKWELESKIVSAVIRVTDEDKWRTRLNSNDAELKKELKQDWICGSSAFVDNVEDEAYRIIDAPADYMCLTRAAWKGEKLIDMLTGDPCVDWQNIRLSCKGKDEEAYTFSLDDVLADDWIVTTHGGMGFNFSEGWLEQ